MDVDWDPDFDSFEQAEWWQNLKPRKYRDPVVLVPGIAGSHLEYRNATGTKWGNLWLDVIRTLPILKNWYKKQMGVTFDPVTETYSSHPSIVPRPADWGGIKGVDYLDPFIKTVTASMHGVIATMKKIGYVVGEDVYGAPYDWRLANANQVKQNGMYKMYKELIERASAENNNKKIHIIAHSAGCIFTRLFLVDFVTEEWKEKYIESFISIAGPYSGSPESFAHMAAPRKWAVPTLTANDVHELVQGFATLHWMLPNRHGFTDEYVLARCPEAGYVFTVGNQSLAFALTNRPEKQAAVEMTMRYVNELRPPNVTTHIMYGADAKTTKEIHYHGDKDHWYKQDGDNVVGPGDGTVPLMSLQAPLVWKTQQVKPVKEYVFNGTTHTNILKNENCLKTVMDLVARDQNAADS